MTRVTDDRHRNKRYELRLSEDEDEQFRVLAKTAGLSVAELIRRCVLGRKIVPKIELAALSEMRKIAGLLKHLHVQGAPTQPAINTVVDAVRHVASALTEARSPVAVPADARFRGKGE